MEELAPQPGCRVSITVHPTPPAPPRVRAEEIVQKPRTMLEDGPSLEDEYFLSKETDKW
jgi:hypothetical protein